MFDLIKSYNSSGNVKIIENENHLKIEVFPLPNYLFEIVVPEGIFEWFVTLYDCNSKEELWSNWTEWYKDEINLLINFQKDVLFFIEKILSATDFKVINKAGFQFLGKDFLKYRELQAKINDEWVVINAGCLPGDFKIE